MKPNVSVSHDALLRLLEKVLTNGSGRAPIAIQVLYEGGSLGNMIPVPPEVLRELELPSLLPGEDDDRTLTPGEGTTPPPARGHRHSEDCSYLHWDGHDWHFKTDIQQAVVRLLVEAYEDGEPDVHQTDLLARAHTDCKRLRDVFKHHPAWGIVIVPGIKPGTFRLCIPV